MSTIETIIIFVAILGLLVCIHEFGHFITSKRAGIRVDEFGFGFPPRIFGRMWRGTLYSLNWIPLGGFVKIKGVAGDDKEAESVMQDPDSFASKPFHTKFLILFAGIGMNILLAMVLFAITFFAGVPADPHTVATGAKIENQRVIINAILPDSPAAEKGLQAGDQIQLLDTTQIESASEFQSSIAEKKPSDFIQMQVERAGEKIIISDIPIKELQNNQESFVGIGIGLQDIATVSYPWYQSIWLGIKTTVVSIGQIFLSLVDLIKNVVGSGSVGENVAGPIGIAVITGKVAQLGIVSLLQFTALLSINLAVFNLLPIPALDGGRIAFVLIEKIRKKPVDQHVEAIVHNIGFILLLLLVLLVTLKDLSQFNIFGFLSK